MPITDDSELQKYSKVGLTQWFPSCYMLAE